MGTVVHKHSVLVHDSKREFKYSGLEEGCPLCHPKKFRACAACKTKGIEYRQHNCPTCMKVSRRERLWKILV